VYVFIIFILSAAAAAMARAAAAKAGLSSGDLGKGPCVTCGGAVPVKGFFEQNGRLFCSLPCMQQRK